jgi:hypothetical protein
MPPTWTPEARVDLLKCLIESLGFEVQEKPGGYLLVDGRWSCYYLKPKDTRKLLKAALNSLPDVPKTPRHR